MTEQQAVAKKKRRWPIVLVVVLIVVILAGIGMSEIGSHAVTVTSVNIEFQELTLAGTTTTTTTSDFGFTGQSGSEVTYSLSIINYNLVTPYDVKVIQAQGGTYNGFSVQSVSPSLPQEITAGGSYTFTLTIYMDGSTAGYDAPISLYVQVQDVV